MCSILHPKPLDIIFYSVYYIKWDDYENNRQSEALREWCKDNKIDIIG